MPNLSVPRAALLVPLIFRWISSVVRNASRQSPVQETSLVYPQAALVGPLLALEACVGLCPKSGPEGSQ